MYTSTGALGSAGQEPRPTSARKPAISDQASRSLGRGFPRFSLSSKRFTGEATPPGRLPARILLLPPPMNASVGKETLDRGNAQSGPVGSARERRTRN